VTTADDPDQPPVQIKHEPRPRIGVFDGEAKTLNQTVRKFTPRQMELRDAVINEFKAKKVSRFVATQVQHINSGRQLAEAIRLLFDDKGRPPANAPLEDIIEEREKIEYQIRWLEAIASELRNKLGKLIEFENDALDLIRQNQDPD
jgi:hypothetical protein